MPLEPSAALAALGEVVRHGTAQATVLKANWQRTAKMLGGYPSAAAGQRVAHRRRGGIRRQRVAAPTPGDPGGPAGGVHHRVPPA